MTNLKLTDVKEAKDEDAKPAKAHVKEDKAPVDDAPKPTDEVTNDAPVEEAPEPKEAPKKAAIGDDEKPLTKAEEKRLEMASKESSETFTAFPSTPGNNL